MSEPLSYFRPDERHAIIIGNNDYSLLRQKEHFGGVHDLEEVKEDVVEVKNGLKSFGFNEFDIRVSQNVDFAAM